MTAAWTVERYTIPVADTPDGAASLRQHGHLIGLFSPARGWRYEEYLGEGQVMNKLAKALGYENQIDLLDAIEACETTENALLMLHAMAAKLNAEGVRL